MSRRLPNLPPADMAPSRFRSLADCQAHLRREREAGRIVWKDGRRVQVPNKCP